MLRKSYNINNSHKIQISNYKDGKLRAIFDSLGKREQLQFLEQNRRLKDYSKTISLIVMCVPKWMAKETGRREIKVTC